ncbi:hypothetical protein H310_09168 [Aphanomyces invadans]|uniref:Uncharacterized protein n=1 Tax=Aphanomyces invadans TaxID=157072 RepID=A0A024TUH7_9STRA|nr:hypothetical protein H310_09168 [Aphanomyces invadans]ETV97820.1 hypothetical protein H310_09168 [Aphanomyces invadans]|eukprot:XP_008873381.1 hypothetical protein H310_09168 [Aphanomyces invadans]
MRRRQSTLAERMDAQRLRYMELKLRSNRDSIAQLRCPNNADKARPLENEAPSCHLHLELPMEVQNYLASLGLRFESITTDEALSRAVSALAVRLYKTDLALEQSILASTPHASM